MDQPPQYQPSTTTSGQWGTSSLGSLGADVMSGLAYLIAIVPFVGFIGQIVLFAIEKNRFAKFHAAQAMSLSVVAYVLGVINFIVSAMFTVGASATDSSSAALGALGISAVIGCVLGIVGLVVFAFWIWGMISGFTGKATKLPLVGGFAEGLAGGPLA
ncbi:MAG TPA: DUF4870 domain-containing protein [Ktedonobacterales bacterium]|nr:DUF4870 domain-containing protein [Ktedonobacterales bacterium]